MPQLVEQWGQQNPHNHSYEEIRDAAIAALKVSPSGQYVTLQAQIAEHFEKVEGKENNSRILGRDATLSTSDADLYMEVFWSLFQQGIITFGINNQNQNFPWFRVSQWGKKFLSNETPYFFTDVTDYERQLQKYVPQISSVTMLYLQEAVQTFKIGALLASSVMVGVAAEHTFNLLVDTVEGNPAYQLVFSKVSKERQILQRLTEFKKVLDAHPEFITPNIKEGLETNFMGISYLIRTFRNDAGHPSGNIIEREQAYVNLQLFIPYAQKLYQLIECFKQP